MISLARQECLNTLQPGNQPLSWAIVEVVDQHLLHVEIETHVM